MLWLSGKCWGFLPKPEGTKWWCQVRETWKVLTPHLRECLFILQMMKRRPRDKGHLYAAVPKFCISSPAKPLATGSCIQPGNDRVIQIQCVLPTCSQAPPRHPSIQSPFPKSSPSLTAILLILVPNLSLLFIPGDSLGSSCFCPSSPPLILTQQPDRFLWSSHSSAAQSSRSPRLNSDSEVADQQTAAQRKVLFGTSRDWVWTKGIPSGSHLTPKDPTEMNERKLPEAALDRSLALTIRPSLNAGCCNLLTVGTPNFCFRKQQKKTTI